MSTLNWKPSAKRGLRVLLWTAAILPASVVAWILTVPGWNQCFTEEVVKGRLWRGMPLSDVSFYLGIGSELETHRQSDGQASAAISRISSLGPYIAPQREITLYFDNDDRLVEAFCNTIYWCEEEGVSLPLREAPKGQTSGPSGARSYWNRRRT
jgi:hypothetical protein